MLTDRQIDALLGRNDTCSIFEGLMAMPHPAKDAADEWDRAVLGRLETQLVRRMRDLLGSEDPGCKDAA